VIHFHALSWAKEIFLEKSTCPTQIELSEMGSSIPMVDKIHPNPLATQAPDPPSYHT